MAAGRRPVHTGADGPVGMSAPYLVSVSLGVFVDFRQGQVGVELVSVFLQDGKRGSANAESTE